MVGLIVTVLIVAIVVWGINQIPMPEPFSWLKVIIYCVLAIWLVLQAARILGSSFSLN